MTDGNGPLTFREYFQEQIDHEQELREKSWTAHRREHEVADRALILSAELARQNKADANEWRSAMSDRERTFLTRGEAEGMTLRLGVLERSDIARTAREQERERAALRTMAVIGLTATIISVAFTILIRVISG